MPFLPIKSSSDLRPALRQRRMALPPAVQLAAARAIAGRIAALPQFRRSRRIGAYLAVRGEIDCGPLLSWARRAGKQIYLPRVRDDGRLDFQRSRRAAPLRRNRFGIMEPDDPAQPLRTAAALDIVFVPLLAFDRRGNRLGMGGGFYDRSLGLRYGVRPRPLRIGLAYDFQHQPRLARAWWDVPLDIVVTPSRLYRFPHRRAGAPTGRADGRAARALAGRKQSQPAQ